MVDNTDLPKLHIVLDASKVNRCIWCGSPQSDNWIPDEQGVFCSQECSKAHHSNLYCVSVFTTIALIPAIAIFILVDLPIESFDRSVGIVSMIALFLMSLGVTYTFYTARVYTKQIPKGSRSHIGVSEVSLLQRVSSPIECPRCDGKIDLNTVGENMVYTCQYCGTNGIIEIEYLR